MDMRAVSERTCPVCGFVGLSRAWTDYAICPSCGTRFGLTDARTSHEELRGRWLSQGAPWKSAVISMPLGWDAREQLYKAGLVSRLVNSSAGTTWSEVSLDVTVHPRFPGVLIPAVGPIVQTTHSRVTTHA
jgi:hypothetical protein